MYKNCSLEEKKTIRKFYSHLIWLFLILPHCYLNTKSFALSYVKAGQSISVVVWKPPYIQLCVNTFLLHCAVVFVFLPSLHLTLFILVLLCSHAAYQLAYTFSWSYLWFQSFFIKLVSNYWGYSFDASGVK